MDNTISVFPQIVSKKHYIQNQIDRIEKALEREKDPRVITQLNYSREYWFDKLEEEK